MLPKKFHKFIYISQHLLNRLFFNNMVLVNLFCIIFKFLYCLSRDWLVVLWLKYLPGAHTVLPLRRSVKHSLHFFLKGTVYKIKISTKSLFKACFSASVVALSGANFEVVGSGPRSGCHKISSLSATCGEMQNLVSYNPEICHKFLSKYSRAVYENSV